MVALSAAAGASCAYVFVELLPELGEAAKEFAATGAHLNPLFPELHVYLAALAGFVVFYGLEHLTSWAERTGRKDAPAYGHGHPIFLLHIGGFAAYAWLVSYAMVGLQPTPVLIGLYAVAMGFHFLTIERALLEEHAGLYRRPGRQILATATLAGWASGAIVELARPVILTATGVIAGGVVVNSLLTELPGSGNGRYWPFALGAAAYAILILAVRRALAA